MSHSSESPLTKPVEGEQSQLLRLPAWRLWAPLLLQTGLILALPAQSFYIQLTGKTVVLQTLPVDPYDLLRGYSQTLNYDISFKENLRHLPGWKELVRQQTNGKYLNLPPDSDQLAVGTSFYIVLKAPASVESTPPKPWKPVRLSSDHPTSVPANQIVLKGKYINGVMKYGLENYYVPEQQRDEINQEISQAQRSRQQQSLVVEVKVDTQGRAVPISLWVSDRNYRF